jgi:hypothetical protein
MLSFYYQINIFTIFMGFMITSSLASHPMEKPSCFSPTHDFVSCGILLVNFYNKSSCMTNIFQNIVCLKPNFFMGCKSHLNSRNLPWAPFSLPFPICNLPLLTFCVHLVVSLLFSAFYYNLL